MLLTPANDVDLQQDLYVPDTFGRYFYHIRVDLQQLLFYVDSHPQLGQIGRFGRAHGVVRKAIKHLLTGKRVRPDLTKAELERSVSKSNSIFVYATEDVARQIEAVLHDVATIQKINKNPRIID